MIRKNRLLEVRVREILIFWAPNHHEIDCTAIFKILFFLKKKKMPGRLFVFFAWSLKVKVTEN